MNTFLSYGISFDVQELYVSNSIINKKALLNTKKVTSSEYNSLNMQEPFKTGYFGYEVYEWPTTTCESNLVSAYGYVFGRCSRGSDSSSYIYNWCALSDDESKIYFRVSEYNGINCTESDLRTNHTFWEYNTCDAVNSRKPICDSNIQGWESYNFDQHTL